MTTINFVKENIYMVLPYNSEVLFIIVVGSMVAHKQTWCRRRSQEFYIQISRQQEEKETLGLV